MRYEVIRGWLQDTQAANADAETPEHVPRSTDNEPPSKRRRLLAQMNDSAQNALPRRSGRTSPRKPTSPNKSVNTASDSEKRTRAKGIRASTARGSSPAKDYNHDGGGGSVNQEEQEQEQEQEEDDDAGGDQITPRPSPRKIASHYSSAISSTSSTSTAPSGFAQQIQKDTIFSLPPPPPSLPASSVSSSSNRTRSSSPVKRPDDLLKLAKPVRWERLNKGELRTTLRSKGSLALLDRVQMSLRKKYIPLQLRHVLEDELDDPQDDDVYYDADRHHNNRLSQDNGGDSWRAIEPWISSTFSSSNRASAPSTSAIPPEVNRLLSIMALEAERRELRDIVTCTNEFTREPGAEPAWNDSIHAPLLRLSVRHTTDVAVENVTRANIAKPFIPTSNEHVDLPLSGKMIDYAFVLRPPLSYTTGIGSGDSSDEANEDLYRRISRFVDTLEPRTFNQTTYERLRLAPSGTFVETKVELKRYPEAQTQLGMWLAAWYYRISMFPPSRSREGGGRGEEGADHQPPVLPVLLVVAHSWELWFAFSEATGIRVCGPVQIGSTENLEDAYRLLAVLRILADWMTSEFRVWIKSLIQ